MNIERMKTSIKLIEILSNHPNYCLSVWANHNIAIVFSTDDQKIFKVSVYPSGEMFEVGAKKHIAIQDTVNALLERIETPYTQELPDCDSGSNYNQPYG